MSCGAQRQLVTDRAQPGDGSGGDVRKVRVMTEGFPRVHVAQVHFDERDPDRQQGIAQGDARMRERCRIEDDECHVRSRRLVDTGDQLGLGVALKRRQVMSGFGRQLPDPPRIFSVNWFLKDENGKFAWPGYGENMRVLKWIVERSRGVSKGTETPLGWMPRYADMDWRGLDFTEDQFNAVMNLDRDMWLKEIALHDDLFFKLGNIAFKRRDPAQATELWQRALELNPRHELVRANLDALSDRT